jgi:methylated-DNA-[protein]-cysteine S-methyltransferase
MDETILSKIEKSDLTPFKKAVYSVATVIPIGCVMTYAQLARAIGRPAAVRAVGNALNKNPFAPEVPCHRVVRSDGSIGGFASGTAKKKRLLLSEGAL